MSTHRHQRHSGPDGSLPDSELYARLMAFGLGRARLLRSVAIRAAGQSLLRGTASLLRRSGDTVWMWQNRYNARQHIDMLDARLLDDVGLRREDVARAAGTPFWRARNRS